MGHRFVDWTFYALIHVFPVICYLLFGWQPFSVANKSQLKGLVDVVGDAVVGFVGGFSKFLSLCKKKKKCSHRKRCARVKATVKKFCRQALAVSLVVHCWHRSVR